MFFVGGAPQVVPELADVAEATFSRNGAGVVLLRAHSTSIAALPHGGGGGDGDGDGDGDGNGADVLVAELLDTALLGEGVLHSLRHAAAAGLLRPGYRAVPARATVLAQARLSSHVSRLSSLVARLSSLVSRRSSHVSRRSSLVARRSSIIRW